MAVKNSPVLAEPGQPRSQTDVSDQDREKIAHMVLSHTLYHLSHCILSHPFLLGMKVQSSPRSDMSSAWLEDTRAACLVHAGSLITVLVEAKAAGYMPVPSLYSYCILVASTIHALHIHRDDFSVSQSSAEYLKTSLEYLSEISELWENAQMMANALKAFAVQCARYSNILLRSDSRVDELTETETMTLRSVVDYWAMMDPRNPVFDMARFGENVFADHLKRDYGYLTPPSHDIIGGIVLDMNITGLGEAKAINPVDPDIFVQFPISAISPMSSEDAGSQWDWDSELSTLSN